MNNRLQLLMILKYIMDNSSESNPISNADIIDFMKKNNLKPCKKTLIETIKIIKDAGFDLITLKKNKTNFYYIPSEHFDTTEARLLTDAVISAKFVTPNKTKVLINKVVNLTDKEMKMYYLKDIVIMNKHKHKNNYIYYSINVIQEALAKNLRITFKYFELDEKITKIYRHKNRTYEVCPITMINGMDNYYMLAYDPNSANKKEKVFRIDRMDFTKLSKKQICQIPFDRNEVIQRYRSSVFSMYSGRRIIAEFEFDFKALNIIYDKYGEDTEVIRIGDDRFYARLPVEDSPTFWGWLLMLNDRIKIISPEFLIKDYNNLIDKLKKQIC